MYGQTEPTYLVHHAAGEYCPKRASPEDLAKPDLVRVDVVFLADVLEHLVVGTGTPLVIYIKHSCL